MKAPSFFSFRSIIFSLLILCCLFNETKAQKPNNSLELIRNYQPIKKYPTDTSKIYSRKILKKIDEHFRKGRPTIGYQSDTVNIVNKDILFVCPLLRFFPLYKELFKNGEVIITREDNDKGYSAYFIFKDSTLYLKRVTQLSSRGTFSNDKKGISKGHLKKVSEKEIKAWIEKMTGRKFDKNGLLKADWVSGGFLGYADGKYFSNAWIGPVYIDYTAYKVIIEKGVLKELIQLR